jgi:hypothetical protein
MAAIQISVISVLPPAFVKTTKGGYNCIEVAYKKDGKVEGKKVMDFVNKEIYNFVKTEMKPGNDYNISLDKDKNDYWQWVGVEAAGATGTVAPADRGLAASAGAGQLPVETKAVGRVTTNTYETPEERALKQKIIVRQSSIGYALSFFEANKGKFGVGDVLELANQFNDWVWERGTPEQEIGKMSDDIPF